MLAGFSLRTAMLIAAIVATQVAGASMLPRTTGFREAGWTVACLATFALSIFLIAETIRQGMALSLIMPILAALVPLATVAVAVFGLGEQASWLRIGLLSAACVLIGAAATV